MISGAEETAKAFEDRFKGDSMSAKAVTEFWERLESDKELQAKFVGHRKMTFAQIVEFAGAHGHEVALRNHDAALQRRQFQDILAAASGGNSLV